MKEQTVFVVDDDAGVCDSIKELVESVGLHAEIFSSADEFLDTFSPQRPGCLVLDVRMAGMSGLVLQEKLNELGADIPVIMLSGHADVPMSVRALKSGAADFIQKPYREQLLLDSINSALAADAAARGSFAEKGTLDEYLAALTEREHEVLDKLLQGSSSKEIAKELGISYRTVEVHRCHILGKLKSGSVIELFSRLIRR